MVRIRTLLLSLGGALVLAACGKEEPAGGLPLAYAPADTPYVLANRELFPEAVMNSWWRRTEPLLAGYSPMLDTLLADLPESARSKHPLAFALLGEAGKLRTRADYEALGFGGNARVALYGVGLSPVLRMELKDPAPFKALITRAEAKAGVKAELAQHAGYDYYRMGDEAPVEVVVALGHGHLVVTLWPKGASETVKNQILAAAPPKANVLAGQQLQKLEGSYGFKGYGSGYLDVIKLADILLQPTAEADKALLKVFKYEAPPLSAECRADVRQLLGKAPRMVFGATRFEDNRMDTLSVLELDSALAKGLVPVAAPIPAVANAARWAGFGIGFNGQALVGFLEERAKAVAADPYKCSELSDLEGELKKAAQQLRAAGGFMNMAKGVAFRLDQLELDMVKKEPTVLDLSVLVASDAPQALVGMAAMGLPQLAQLGLEADGQPKALPLDDVPAELSRLGAAWAVMTDKALAVRFATQDNGAGVKALVDAPLTAPGTLLTYSFSGELYRMLAASIRAGADPSMPPEAQEQMAKFMESYANLIGRFENSILLTPRGVEIQQVMTLQ